MSKLDKKQANYITSVKGDEILDTMNSIIERRSIRKYKDQVVADEVITQLLKAGMYAPSAGNQQSWEFIVVKNKETLVRITEIHPYSQMLKEVSVAIVVCGNLQKEKYKDYSVQDCSAATQNILLAAHAAGLGTVWLGVYPVADRINGVKEILGLPENIVPLSIIPIGYPAEKKEVPDRYNESYIHHEKW